MELVGDFVLRRGRFRLGISVAKNRRFMVAIFLGAFGIVTIVPLSLGNNPNSHGPKRHAIALLVTLLYSV
jgi:hypothetical protein